MIVYNPAYEAATVDACQLVGSAAHAAVPAITESDLVSVRVSDLLVAGMDIGAGHRPFDQASANVVRSAASRTAHTAVPPSNILQHDSDVAINRYNVPSAMIDDRDKRFTAIVVMCVLQWSMIR